MNGRHATPRELEWYVTGALDTVRTAFVEQHATNCRTCAAVLANEARLEVAFEQLAERVAVTRTSGGAREPTGPADRGFSPLAEHPWKGAGYGVFGVVAMAAAMLLWLGRPAAATGDGATAVRGGIGGLGDGAVEARADSRDGG